MTYKIVQLIRTKQSVGPQWANRYNLNMFFFLEKFIHVCSIGWTEDYRKQETEETK